MKTLRDYQSIACDYICDRLDNYKRPFIYVLACGTGKSLVIAELAKRCGKVLVLTISAELCRQDYEEMLEYGIEARAFSASMNTKEVGDITVATIGSAYKNPYLFEDADVVIIDEVQSVNPADPKTMFMKLLAQLNKFKRDDGKCIKIVGLTATAYRNVQKLTAKGRWYETTTYVQPLNRIPCGKGFLWSSIVEGMSTQEALDRKYLTPVEYHNRGLGAGGLMVNSTGAEYTDDSLELWGDDAVSACFTQMVSINDETRSGIVALPFIKHAEELKVLCDGAGLSSVVVSSKTPAKERKQAISDFKAGKIKWLLQCNIANVGFNSPITDTLIWARPTLSLNLWQQAVGRVMRLCDNKPLAHVYDLVGTIDLFGYVEDVHLGKEDGFKTTIEGTYGKLSGTPLKTFHFERKNRSILEEV